MLLPDSIDNDPRRQRVIGVCQPAGQLQATRSALNQRRCRTIKDLQKTTRYAGTRLTRVTAAMQSGIVRFTFGYGENKLNRRILGQPLLLLFDPSQTMHHQFAKCTVAKIEQGVPTCR